MPNRTRSRSIQRAMENQHSLAYCRRTQHGPNEIHRLLPQISSRMLAKALRELERDGLLLRQVTTTSPVKVFYSKTELTDSLMDVFKDIDAWQKVHMDSIRMAREQYDAQNR